MTQTPRVVVLTTKLPEDIWLINRVAEVSEIAGIVMPRGRRYPEYRARYVLKKRIPKHGVLKVADQAFLVAFRLLFESKRDRRAEAQLLVGSSPTHIEHVGFDILETEDVNSDEVRSFIVTKKPQLVVVSGAPLLKKPIIDAAQGNIINVHPGYAPQYRGRYGSFWPIYNHEPELVGTTVHFVDQGVDTGRILLQQLVEFDPKDTLRTITLRQHVVGVDLLVRCLKDFDTYAASAHRKTGCPDGNYLAPGLSHYLKGRGWLRTTRRPAKRQAVSNR